jgi:hypothetical protein
MLFHASFFAPRCLIAATAVTATCSIAYINRRVFFQQPVIARPPQRPHPTYSYEDIHWLFQGAHPRPCLLEFQLLNCPKDLDDIQVQTLAEAAIKKNWAAELNILTRYYPQILDQSFINRSVNTSVNAEFIYDLWVLKNNNQLTPTCSSLFYEVGLPDDVVATKIVTTAQAPAFLRQIAAHPHQRKYYKFLIHDFEYGREGRLLAGKLICSNNTDVRLILKADPEHDVLATLYDEARTLFPAIEITTPSANVWARQNSI